MSTRKQRDRSKSAWYQTQERERNVPRRNERGQAASTEKVNAHVPGERSGPLVPVLRTKLRAEAGNNAHKAMAKPSGEAEVMDLTSASDKTDARLTAPTTHEGE